MRTLKTNSDFRLPRGIAQCLVQVIRESPRPYGPQPEGHDGFPLVDDPGKAAAVFASFVESDPEFDWDRETFVVLLLSTRRRVIAWQKLSVGTLDTLLVHPRDVFRLAIVANAHAVILMHNHPSGDPMPSEADTRVTREMIKAGQLLKIEVVDHVIVGNPELKPAESRGWSSLRELGYFYV